MFTVASYNIRNGSMSSYQDVGGDILQAGADFAGIQEVDKLTSRNGNVDAMPVISESCGLSHYEFASAFEIKGGEYGIGLLSRIKPDMVEKIALPGQPGIEPRTCVIAHFCTAQIDFYFINTHLSVEDAGSREKQFEFLGEYISKLKKPFILTGDFNTDDFELFKLLGKDIALLNNKDNYLPSFYPDNIAIDNIVISKEFEFKSGKMYTATKNSDHYMLLAQIDVK